MKNKQPKQFIPVLLNHNLEIIIPEKDQVGNKIDISEVKDILSKFIHICFDGGPFITGGSSFWGNEQNETFGEECIILSVSFKTDKLIHVIRTVLLHYCLLAHELNQASIAIKLDGQMIITPSIIQESMDENGRVPLYINNNESQEQCK